jgi:hypothetical protein
MRMKHYRGRKVHSPFVYGIVRSAIMKKKPSEADTALFDELRGHGFSKRRAAQLQNLYVTRGFTSVVFAEEAGGSHDDAPKVALDAGTLCFAMPSLPALRMPALVEEAKNTGATLCLVSPCESRARHRMARLLVREHAHTSIDNRGFLLLFFDERLPKQHFKL